MIKRFNFQELWKRKAAIAEGYFNKYVNFWNKRKITKISNERLALCRLNACGYYDPEGLSSMAYIKGKESCGGCGCVLKEKTSCLGCSCFLEEINQVPIWTAVK